MPKVKAVFTRKAIALSLPLLGYLVTSVLNIPGWGNILSPLNAFLSAGILLFSYSRSDRRNLQSVSLLFFALACFVWGLADVTWAVTALTGEDPSVVPALWVMYTLPNVLIVFALIAFAIHEFTKWSFVQICVDALVICLMSAVFLWIAFLNKDITVLAELMQADFTSVFSILSDVVIFVAVFLWIMSIRSGKIPRFILIITSGVVLFAAVDMLYYYLDFRGLYFPDSLTDFGYALSLYVLAMGGLWRVYRGNSAYSQTSLTNVGLRSHWGYLLFFPLVTIVLSATKVIEVDFNFVDLATYIILILLYRVFSKYVQISIENEKLLKIEILNSKTLEQRVQEQVKELAYLANQDTLTSLYNRRFFMMCLEESIKTIRPKEVLALLLLDLDRFKTINDSFGHDAGDRVLIELGGRLTQWNNYGATLARLGGDEFGLIFAGKYTQKEIEDFCAQIIQLCDQPICIDGQMLDITISIGVDLLSPESGDAKQLMKNADIAMYQAKAQGYNKYQFFDPIFSLDVINSNKIEMLLKQADIEKDFELFYQPQFSLPDKKLIGAEALIRWKSSEHGYIPPNVFIPVAEKIEYITKIGKWVLKESIRQAVAWNRTQSFPIKVGINISPRQLNDEAFIDILKFLILESGIDAAWLDTEITESTMIGQTEKVLAVFELLKELGLSISTDDFGTGYSALNYLNKYPFDRIKIDKSLIDNISASNTAGVQIVKSIILMAKSIGIIAIAEGVETEEQLDVLKNLGCEQVQGYLLGRPVPAQVFEHKFMNLA